MHLAWPPVCTAASAHQGTAICHAAALAFPASPPLHRETIFVTQCPHEVSLEGTGEEKNTFPSFFSYLPCSGVAGTGVPQPENKVLLTLLR